MADIARNQRNRRHFDARQADFSKQDYSTLPTSELRNAVKLPQGEDLNEWLAVNVSDFYKQVTMLYGTISDSCTIYSCPSMTAGPKFEYTWTENEQIIPCSAPDYIDFLFSSIQDELDDENVFPAQIGKSFPQHFVRIVQTIARRLFRVFAHIYHEHFELIKHLKSTAHLNTSFKHFMLFVQEFKLIETAELGPLHSFIQELIPSMIPDYLLNGASSSSSQS